jgi:hypothetical protein
MILKTKPTLKELVLCLIASISLIGLLVLAYQDIGSRQAFLQAATFSIGALAGRNIEQK